MDTRQWRRGCVWHVALLLACHESPVAEYADFAAAQRAGAVARGWIPHYVPRTATSIVEVHDLDMNTQRLRFRAPAEDLRALATLLVPLPLEEAREPGVDSPALPGEWVPELDPSARVATARRSIEFFRLRGGEPGARCLAIDWATLTVFAWSCVDRII